MREIKYRAWDETDKIMKFFDFYKIHCEAYYPNHWKDSTGLACELDDVIRYPNELMHYTGLKDKNGIEICEGDIVELNNRFRWSEYKSNIFEVKMQPPRLWLKGEKFGYEGELLIEPEYCVIIGNIHENPKLMEKK